MNRRWPLLAVLASVLVLWQSNTLSAQPPQSTAQSARSAAPANAATGKSYLAHYVSRREQMYYETVWGVDSLRVKYTESGEIIRFSYRVVDPERAVALNEKKAEPTLIDPQAGVSLVVPEVTNIGKMRQTSTPKAGMTYWMGFSNSGRPVKRGDRVDVVIGHFRAGGLVVE
ncbi:MAG TPA: hypothetical protein VEV41_18930 [Terriglobales bacterium]|nr:hypothetical protein [Terriglobales bacterium]